MRNASIPGGGSRHVGGLRYTILCGVGQTPGDYTHECDAEKFQCMGQREQDENAWADGNGGGGGGSIMQCVEKRENSNSH